MHRHGDQLSQLDGTDSVGFSVQRRLLCVLRFFALPAKIASLGGLEARPLDEPWFTTGAVLENTIQQGVLSRFAPPTLDPTVTAAQGEWAGRGWAADTNARTIAYGDQGLRPWIYATMR